MDRRSFAGIAGALGVGALIGYWLANKRAATKKALPAPSICPVQGVPAPDTELAPVTRWLFFANQFANLEFCNKVWDMKPGGELYVSYPARLKRSAGFCRVWGMSGHIQIGQQTIAWPFPTAAAFPDRLQSGRVAPAEYAHALVGVLIPFTEEKWNLFVPEGKLPGGHLEEVNGTEFEWLSWTGRPDMDTVYVHCMDWAPTIAPPSQRWPLLQSNIDTVIQGALVHGEQFAGEWMDTIGWWSANWINDRTHSRRPWVDLPEALDLDEILMKHPCVKRNYFSKRSYSQKIEGVVEESHGVPMPAGCHITTPPAAKGWFRKAYTDTVVANFVIGFGSIIQTASRSGSDPSSRDAAPCRVKSSFGYVREWNFQSPTSQICALGLRKTSPGEKGATINGVIFSAPDDMSSFDVRENGYKRVQIPNDQIEMLSWQTLPASARVYIYVPYSPSVVKKYGNNADGTALCMGPDEPAGLVRSVLPLYAGSVCCSPTPATLSPLSASTPAEAFTSSHR